MKFRFRLKLILVTTLAAIVQIGNVAAVNAESKPIERIVSQVNLASSLLTPKSLPGASDLPTAKDLLAQSKKRRKPLIRRKPAQPAATTEPTEPTVPPLRVSPQQQVELRNKY